MTLPRFSDDPVEQGQWEEFDTAQMNHAYPVCQFCSKPVDDTNGYRRVYGWVGSSGKDGFIRDGYGDERAHKTCIEINKTVGPDQQGLW